MTADEYAFKQAHQEFVEPGFQFESSFDESQPFVEWLAHKKDQEDPSKVPSGRHVKDKTSAIPAPSAVLFSPRS